MPRRLITWSKKSEDGSICAVLGGTLALDSRFREKSYGRAEGKPRSWLDERFIPPPEFGARSAHDEGIDGAGTMEVFARRVYSAVDDVLRQNIARRRLLSQSPDSSSQ
nr:MULTISPECIES: histidine phosphatase family protein [unclassified Rhodococcus (in: high G+C Gram-positive bacteria)]